MVYNGTSQTHAIFKKEKFGVTMPILLVMTTEAQSYRARTCLDETLRGGQRGLRCPPSTAMSPQAAAASEVLMFCDFYQPQERMDFFSFFACQHFPSVKTWGGRGGLSVPLEIKAGSLFKYQNCHSNSSIYVKCPGRGKSMAIYREQKIE